MTPRILYLGTEPDLDTHTARLLLQHLRETTGNRALWVNAGDKGVLLVVQPKGYAC